MQLAIAATGSRGGAIWVIQPKQSPQCYCHVDLELCQVNEPQQQTVISQALERTVKEGKSLVLPAEGVEAGPQTADSGNKCGYPLFFKPLKAASQVAMILQLIGMETLTPHDYRAVVGILDQAGEAAETYLAHRRAVILEDDRKSLAQLLQYSEGVHASLEPEKVIYQVANLGRDTVGCNRVVVWIDPKVKRALRAVSGVDKPDRRAVLLQSIEKLSQHCLTLKKPIVASREQLAELPEEEELTYLLKDYFNVSQLDQIFLQPIKAEDKYIGVITAEGFEEQTATNLAGVLATISKHAGVALNNALEMAAVPMIRPLARIKKVKENPQKRRKWIAVLVGLLMGMAGLIFVPWTIKTGCSCELVPKQRRSVVSPLDTIQIAEIVRETGFAETGAIIARLDEFNLQRELEDLQYKWKQEDISWESAQTEVEEEIAALEKKRLENQMKLVKDNIGKCQVKMPISGIILTPDLKHLERSALNKGDLICEVADLDHWQLVLDVPQEEVNWVQLGLQESGESEVKFFLEAFPESELRTYIKGAGQIGHMARLKEEGNFFEVRVDVSAEELNDIKQGLRGGMVGQAKIFTTKRCLGYVLLRKVIRFFRVTFF